MCCAAAAARRRRAMCVRRTATSFLRRRVGRSAALGSRATRRRSGSIMTRITMPVVDVHLPPDHRRTAMAADVEAGLSASPKTLPPVWFYDERGSALFDEITRLPEYYPTRSDRTILTDHADEIVDLAG